MVYEEGEARAIYRMVMELRFGLSQTDLLLGKDTDLSAEDQAELEIIMQRLLRKEPVQYVLGFAEFCGRRFSVEPGVLIPRPETQLLVEEASKLLSLMSSNEKPSLLDIGTGSGCIAITMALKGCKVAAIDISPEALRIAGENACRMGVEVEFRCENILHPKEGDEHWDIIVSNPPYVCQDEARQMAENVLLYEPHLALFVPDDNPLLFCRAISGYALRHLNPGGHLLMEINSAYGPQVKDLMQTAGFIDVCIRQDQFGRDRMVSAKYIKDNGHNF
jgi:release factor glutamine methyltransferase